MLEDLNLESTQKYMKYLKKIVKSLKQLYSKGTLYRKIILVGE